MAIFISLIILICGYKIFSSKNSKRINWFLISHLLIYSSTVLTNKPQITSSFFFILCYFLSLIRFKEFNYRQIPLKPIWILYIIGFLIISIHAVKLSYFSMLWKPTHLFLNTYFVIFLGFFSAKSFKGFNRHLAMIILAVCLYGILTYIIKADPIRSIITPDYKVGYYFGERLRVASTWSHPIAYGFICSVLFNIIFIYKNTPLRKILLLCLLINIFICGSRTVLLTFLLMISFNIIIGLKGSHKWKIIIGTIFISICTYIFIPIVTNKIDQLILSAQGIDTVGGSSTDMRKEQLEASFMIASQFLITGGGFDYIQEVMGYGSNIDDQYWMEYGDLQGFESLFYQILIERGILGLVIESITILAIIIWLLRKRKINQGYSTLSLSILLGFVIFALMTGSLDTWVLTMFFIGIYMGKINLKDHKEPQTTKIQIQQIHNNE